MEENVIHQTPYHRFASPRYNVARGFSTQIIPEDYGYYDAVNGTYDKFYPCYKLTETDKPKLECVLADNQITEMKGVLELRPTRTRYKSEVMGKRDNPDRPTNTNLDRKEIFYSEYSGIKLNPGWSVIQVRGKNTGTKVEYSPMFLIRTLGNDKVVREVHAFQIEDSKVKLPFSAEVPVGTLVEYKKNLWKAIRPTKALPPEKANIASSEWKLFKADNVFQADVFAIGKGTSTYVTEVIDNDRKFEPNKQTDNSLICWNVAYYHS